MKMFLKSSIVPLASRHACVPYSKLAPDYREPTIGLETINSRQHRRKETDDGRAKKIVRHKS